MTGQTAKSAPLAPAVTPIARIPALCATSQRTPRLLQPSPTAEMSTTESPILRSCTSALYSKTDHEQTDMNELILAPTTPPETPPVEYIEAAGAGGYADSTPKRVYA